MPEIPDLEAYRSYFNKRLPGQTVQSVAVHIPIVLRASADELAGALTGHTIGETQRIGKYLLIPFPNGASEDDAPYLVIHAMLTGRFQYAGATERKPARAVFSIRLDSGKELRYFDTRLMGKVYLARKQEFAQKVPRWAEMGPDALSPELTEDVFHQRLHNYRGQIKSILTKEQFIAGIGNAYSDEILFVAGIHPYRRRVSLAAKDETRLYQALRSVLGWAIPIVEERMETDGLPRHHYRSHLKVHRKGGQPCPNCGAAISEITAGQRSTNFCRHCQPED